MLHRRTSFYLKAAVHLSLDCADALQCLAAHTEMPDFLEMQSFTRSEWRPRKSARGLEREADARINLSAALEIAAEDVFGIEPKIGIAAQRQVGANTGVIPSFFVGV